MSNPTPSDPDPTAETPDQVSSADARLLQEIGAVLQAVDPVPQVLRDQARDLLIWRDIDAQLQLLVDPDEVLAGVRSATTVDDPPALLTMQGPDGLVVGLEISRSEDGSHRVLGQVAGVTPSATAVVAIRIGDRISHTTVDEHGTFELEGLSSGRMRLLLQLGDEPMLTPWFTL